MTDYLNNTLEHLVMPKTPIDLIVASINLALMSCLSIYFGARSSILSVQKNKEEQKEAELKSPLDALKSTLTIICFQVSMMMSEYLNETLQDHVMKKVSVDFLIVACISIMLMSCLSICFGALSSIFSIHKNKEKHTGDELKSPQDALILTLIFFGSLIGICVFLKLFSIRCIIFLINLVFTIDMIIYLKDLLKPFVSKLVPENYQICYNTEINIRSDDIITYGVSSLIVGIYFWYDFWILKNIFGIIVAIQRITDRHLNNVTIACTLLGSQAICDMFWIFTTDVMITIANSVKIPYFLVFPRDVLYNWENGSKFMIFRLRNVIFPGCFIALLLRFDERLNRGEKLYFHSGIVAYIAGFVVTVAVNLTFQHEQPELLYLVPACIGIPCLVAVIKGDIDALLTYHDY